MHRKGPHAGAVQCAFHHSQTRPGKPRASPPHPCPFVVPHAFAIGATDVWKCRAPGATLRAVNLRPILLFLLASTAAVRGDGTALDALRLLPKDAAKRLARIEAREGAPVPERWYLLVQDPDAARGLREFAVAGGRIAANRTLSQFANSLEPADVVGADSVKCDSDQVARLAALFAQANGARVGSILYELAKDPATNAPLWRATILDPAGDQLGVLVITAAKGAVVSHQGFEKEPAPGISTPAKPATSGSRGPAGRVATPSPAPKPSLLRRIFGASEGKPAKVP